MKTKQRPYKSKRQKLDFDSMEKESETLLNNDEFKNNWKNLAKTDIRNAIVQPLLTGRFI